MTSKPVILFVDDEERIVKLLKIMFRNDYEVYTALGANDALAILETKTVDVIISDQRMPDMTGIQLLSQVRERWPNTVRLLLTGYSDLVAIVGAVNEGEVYRFINKPWNQSELRSVIAEAVEYAQESRKLEESIGSVWQNDGEPPFSVASQLLAIEGCEADRQDVVEMFTYDYRVHAVASLKDAISVLSQEEIGVIVTNAEVDGVDVTDLLSEIAQFDPAITVVVMTKTPHSDTIIKLINSGKIYRFAMQPLSPNLFRLAVHAAMREHHRRLADPRVVRRRKLRELHKDGDNDVYTSLVESLRRFTEINNESDSPLKIN
ncbi:MULTISPECIES: response regulator [Brucella/Ochrobactrum group]|jgi:DNA-binding NtrC family response regulator|uniref:response regulator n=1 Tax=Brucella/Ochrobactrum group TaxID=2826938 RepID=UPI001C0597C6|nr:response regulator [Brucella sp. NBRC 12950]QWK80616.1 response regulator [Ochrobactrum sp. BTU1]GLU27937.1 two-component system response regulator [Brucella sp. NBRC 12950]